MNFDCEILLCESHPPVLNPDPELIACFILITRDINWVSLPLTVLSVIQQLFVLVNGHPHVILLVVSAGLRGHALIVRLSRYVQATVVFRHYHFEIAFVLAIFYVVPVSRVAFVFAVVGNVDVLKDLHELCGINNENTIFVRSCGVYSVRNLRFVVISPEIGVEIVLTGVGSLAPRVSEHVHVVINSL
jgi:hypothetical protein